MRDLMKAKREYTEEFPFPAGKKQRILSRDLSPWVNQASNTGTGLDLRVKADPLNTSITGWLIVSLRHEEDSLLEILLLVGEKAENLSQTLLLSLAQVQRTDTSYLTSHQLQVLNLMQTPQWM